MRIRGNDLGRFGIVSGAHAGTEKALLPPDLFGVTDRFVRTGTPAAERAAVASHGSTLLLPTVLALLAAICGPPAWATAHPPTGVVEALQKKYQVTQTTPDSAQITKDGTTMSMKSAGIYALPSGSMMEPDNKVVDGKIQAPSMFARVTLMKMGTHVLQSGEKVYITKIESKGDTGDQLRFTLLTVESLDVSSGGQSRYKAVVSFKFKKGYLDDAPPDDVEQAVEAVLAPDTGGDDAQGGDNSGGQNQGPPAAAPPPPVQRVAAPPPPPPPPPAAPAGPPPTISIGESSTQVLQAMGMPLQMIDLGKKKTFIYKNMKIIFMDDKVSDVE
ncbi:MAG: hypothetical protein WB622_07190 [Acidobacteriaceae bacterium]